MALALLLCACRGGETSSGGGGGGATNKVGQVQLIQVQQQQVQQQQVQRQQFVPQYQYTQQHAQAALRVQAVYRGNAARQTFQQPGVVVVQQPQVVYQQQQPAQQQQVVPMVAATSMHTCVIKGATNSPAGGGVRPIPPGGVVPLVQGGQPPPQQLAWSPRTQATGQMGRVRTNSTYVAGTQMAPGVQIVQAAPPLVSVPLVQNAVKIMPI